MKSILFGLLLIVPLQLQAGPIFGFTFDNVDGNVAGTVSGTIFGLQDNVSGQSATSIVLNSYPAGLLGSVPSLDVTTWTSQVFNNFSVVNGAITLAAFQAQNVSGDETDSFSLGNGTYDPTNCCAGVVFNNALTFDNGNHVAGNQGALRGVEFSQVPTPATLALFGLGLAGLGWSRRKKV